ncbi:MAG: primosomal protein N' [bacterium]|nr:primosomal protein N' [bacterium]
MRNPVLVQVVVDQAVFYIDKPYDYLLPEKFVKNAAVGCRVIVPFGRTNKKRVGMIIGFSDNVVSEKIKSVISLKDETPILTQEMISLAAWLKEHTFCTWFDAIKVITPPGINYRFVCNYKIGDGVDQQRVNELEGDLRRAAMLMLNSTAPMSREKILKSLCLEADSDILDKLVSMKILVCDDNEVRRVGDASQRMVRLADREPMIKLTQRQTEVFKLLSEIESCSVKEVCYYTGVTASVINSLKNKGIVEIFDQVYFRKLYDQIDKVDNTEINLTNQQQAAYNTLVEKYNSQQSAVALLYGVTGSGKTQVFLKLCDEAVKSGRGVIVMVPEISLTSQTLKIFNARYGDKVAVFHSAMSQGNRMDEWRRIKSGEAKIAVGTRSAVFAPFEDIGLIIIDEEQEYTYKSEKSPRFHARDVAKFRAFKHNSLVVLASATPSIESYSAALSGRYALCRLDERYGNAILPKVITVDMRNEVAKGNMSAISSTLYQGIKAALDQKQQVILLLNRRGYNTYVSCPSCGYVVNCKNCSISMTYHSANSRLMCHYCGASEEYSDKCPECGSGHMRYSGLGTQKIEQEVNSIFPGVRVLRLDADSMMTRKSYEEGLQRFAQGDYDIMLGTQMVAKGLDFKNVTLVGVLGADQSMYHEDFRSFERTFSLLTQVVGRSGRGDKEGVAIIQTNSPESRIIQLAASQNYDDFYKDEILTRKLMVYPPYCDLAVLCASCETQNVAEEAINSLLGDIKAKISDEFSDVKVIILGPTPASVVKVKGRYRYRLIIKCRNSANFRKMLTQVITEFSKQTRNKSVSVYVDINPDNLS